MFEINIPIIDMQKMATLFSHGQLSKADLELLQANIEAYHEADIIDLWGAYKLSSAYEDLFSAREFLDLNEKFQLGICHFHNATHTRAAHSIGTSILCHRLASICEKKFGNVIEADLNAIRLFGLIHDLGHHAYSHSTESFLPGTHEEQTIDILKNSNSDTYKVIIEYFGEEVLLKLIGLVDSNEYQNNEFLTMIRPLLSGGIDVDRIDYIYRDARYVLGDGYKENYSKVDFSDLLEHIDIEIIDGKPQIVFDEKSLDQIKAFFAIKYELHDIMYYGGPTSILEEIYYKFATGYNLGITWETNKAEIEEILLNQMKNGCAIVQKYADTILKRDLDSNFMIRVIESDEEFEKIMQKLYFRVPSLKEVEKDGVNSCLHTSKRTLNMYKSKDNVLIKCNDGSIKNLSEINSFDSETKKIKNTIGIDITLLAELTGLNIEELTNEANKALSLIDKSETYVYRYRDPFLRDFQRK